MSHKVDVALRELAMEKIRKEKFPPYPSSMASLYVSQTYEETERWGEYFARLGRPTYGVAKIDVNGNCYYGDAYKLAMLINALTEQFPKKKISDWQRYIC